VDRQTQFSQDLSRGKPQNSTFIKGFELQFYGLRAIRQSDHSKCSKKVKFRDWPQSLWTFHIGLLTAMFLRSNSGPGESSFLPYIALPYYLEDRKNMTKTQAVSKATKKQSPKAAKKLKKPAGRGPAKVSASLN
jgi:hypothetical protein